MNKITKPGRNTISSMVKRTDWRLEREQRNLRSKQGGPGDKNKMGTKLKRWRLAGSSFSFSDIFWEKKYLIDLFLPKKKK